MTARSQSGVLSSDERCKHWRSCSVPTNHTGVTTMGGCPYCEIERLERIVNRLCMIKGCTLPRGHAGYCNIFCDDSNENQRSPLPVGERIGASRPEVALTSKTSKFECSHSGFDEGGVCTCCREFYSAEHDQHPNDIHPAMARLVARAKAQSEQS